MRHVEAHPVASSAIGFLFVLLLGGFVTSAADETNPCSRLDDAVAPQLASLLDRRDAESTRLIYRAILARKIAREYCDRGWVEAGLVIYGELNDRIGAYLRRDAVKDG
jgi:hypothetical protein